MNQTSLEYNSYSLHRTELASRTLFPVKSSIQNKVTHHRVVGDGCI